MATEQPHWEQCSRTGCTGVRLPTVAWCLAHAAEQAPDAVDAELKRINAEGTVDARGVVISAELLARLLDAVPRKEDRPTFTVAWFGGATFKGEAGFGGATFKGEAGFGGATFESAAEFAGATFDGPVTFDQVSFRDDAGFAKALFRGATQFGLLAVDERLTLDDATFARATRFEVLVSNSDSRRAIAYLASPVTEASIPLLPSQWAAAAVEGRGDLAVHGRAMIQAVRPALRPRLVPGPRCGRPCWPGQV